MGNIVNIIVLNTRELRSNCFNNLLTSLNVVERWGVKIINIDFINFIDITFLFPLFPFQSPDNLCDSWRSEGEHASPLQASHPRHPPSSVSDEKSQETGNWAEFVCLQMIFSRQS